MTESLQSTDERPLSKMKISGQLAYYHQLTDQEIGEAMGKFTDGQVRILALIARGVGPKEALAQTTIKANTLTSWKRNPLFRDCYYSLASDSRPISIEGIRALAQSHAVDSTLNIIGLVNLPVETAAERTAALNANKEILVLAGDYKDTTTQPVTIQIAQALIAVDQRLPRDFTKD